jgi:hypothetical protein
MKGLVSIQKAFGELHCVRVERKQLEALPLL